MCEGVADAVHWVMVQSVVRYFCYGAFHMNTCFTSCPFLCYVCIRS